ncbi:acyl-CoA thioester hydrolase/BAAT C-terminal domain-containing protein [Kribbella sp. NPDC023855]|uniref:acyl-CoA thioester hydrolase/BAAT C-terminal domain-containing protein n=1 Tax=Kribbella sp. NPDC023855 TaxID=3154698 RepID=UPI0033F2444A
MIADVDLHWSRPREGTGTGVLVLAGSSGRLDSGRADVLASAGATALALRWFGGVGQPTVPCEVALETFTQALDLLAADCDRLAVMGLSYGAEAALLTAVRDPRIAAVVALAPTDVVWEGHHQDDADPPRSKWTWDGEPLPFVPLDRSWVPDGPIPAFASHYLRSREAAGTAVVEAARIPIEHFRGDLVLVAGGDDQVWPSVSHARAIAASRTAHGLDTVVVEDPAAGHPITLPGETPANPTRPYLVGGNPDAAKRLGKLAWPAIRTALNLH